MIDRRWQTASQCRRERRKRDDKGDYRPLTLRQKHLNHLDTVITLKVFVNYLY